MLVGPRAPRLRRAVRLRRRAPRRVVSARCSPTSPWARSVRAGLRRRRRGRRGPRRGVPRPQPAGVEPRRAPARPVAHRFEWLAPVLRRQRRLRGVPGRAGGGGLRRARLPAAHDRAHLRGVRPPGLRPAHRRHRPHPARHLGRGPQGAPRRPRPTGSGCAPRSACSALQTLVVVASALHRMHLYQEAYGFTQLRLLVDVFEGWLGLLVLGVSSRPASPLRAVWLPRFALLSGAVALLGARGGQPGRVDRPAQPRPVRRHRPHRLDLPAAASPTTPCRCSPTSRPTSGAVRSPTATQADDDWLEWNLGRARAAGDLPGPSLAPDELASLCPDS